MATITGERGEVRWGYQVAAVLHPWSMTTLESGGWALLGTCESADTYRVSQHPLVFVAPNGWRWPVASLQVSGASLSATLGPKERVHATESVRQT
jgi:hypothetical protein